MNPPCPAALPFLRSLIVALMRGEAVASVQADRFGIPFSPTKPI
jgi:hypothetical protein